MMLISQQEEEEESKLLNDVMDMNMMEHDMNLNMQHANDAEQEQQQEEEKDIILQVKQVMHQQVDDHDDPCAPCSVLRPFRWAESSTESTSCWTSCCSAAAVCCGS